MRARHECVCVFSLHFFGYENMNAEPRTVFGQTKHNQKKKRKRSAHVIVYVLAAVRTFYAWPQSVRQRTTTTKSATKIDGFKVGHRVHREQQQQQRTKTKQTCEYLYRTRHMGRECSKYPTCVCACEYADNHKLFFWLLDEYMCSRALFD